MIKGLYRVEFTPLETKPVRTKDSNYGKSLNFDYYEHFLSVYDNIMEQVNLPVDFLVSVNNQIYTNAEDYLQLLNNCIFGNQLDIYKVTNNLKHNGYSIPVPLIMEFLESFDDENQFIWFDNGTFLWEYFYEKVRQKEFNDLPSRLTSTFFFDKIESCKYYITNHCNGIGQTKNVEILETEKLFKGDMNIMDTIENSISRDELINVIRKYWKGEKSDNPIMETVFQGKFQFIN